MTRTVAFLSLLLALSCARAVPGKTYSIPSDAMAPSIRKGDRIGCSRTAPDPLPRGAVVVFSGEGTRWTGAANGTYVKRVVGLPGETVEGGKDGVLVNGALVPEPYVTAPELPGDFGPVTVPPGEYFLLGDNRDRSSDSRVNGTIPHRNVLGTCSRIVAPGERKGRIPGT